MDLDKETQKRIAREELFNSACHACKSGISFNEWQSNLIEYAEKYDILECLDPIYEMVWNSTKRSMFCG